MMLSLAAPLADLVLPRFCIGCERPGSALCCSCRSGLTPLRTRLDGLVVVGATGYDGAVRRALLAYKERGRRDLAAPLAGLLCEALRALLGLTGVPARDALVVCVPSARAAIARRGGDHVARLARRAAPRAGIRMAAGVLRLERAVADSAGLGADERAHNLRGAMRARPAVPSLRRRSVIVVDDVASSGSTLREAGRALRATGWRVAGAATLTATPARTASAALTWRDL